MVRKGVEQESNDFFLHLTLLKVGNFIILKTFKKIGFQRAPLRQYIFDCHFPIKESGLLVSVSSE